MAQNSFSAATSAPFAILGIVVAVSLVVAQDKKPPTGGEKSAGEKSGEKSAGEKAKEPAKTNEKTAAFNKLSGELLDTIRRLAEIQQEYRLANKDGRPFSLLRRESRLRRQCREIRRRREIPEGAA